MANIEKLRENLERRGFKTSYFETAQEAVDYLDKEIDGVSVGIGGSMTVKAIGLYDKLKTHNEMHWHWEGGTLEDLAYFQAEVGRGGREKDGHQHTPADGPRRDFAVLLLGTHEGLVFFALFQFSECVFG